jgi:hypothetical protein
MLLLSWKDSRVLVELLESSMSELWFAKFEPFKCALLHLRTLNRLNAFRTSTVYAIFAFIRIYLRINAYSIVIIRFCP